MIKAELHCHTNYSKCSNLTLDNLIKICIKKGIDVLAVTDHNTIEGALALIKMKPPFRVIISEEICSEEGDVIGYFLKEEIEKKLPIEETVKRIKAQGGLVGIPHPFCSFRKGTGKFLEKVIKEIDMMEIFNGRNLLNRDNAEAKAFAEKHHIRAIVGSDAHFKTEVGNATVLMEDFQTKEEFLNNLQKAKFVTRSSPFWEHGKTLIWREIRKVI